MRLSAAALMLTLAACGRDGDAPRPPAVGSPAERVSASSSVATESVVASASSSSSTATASTISPDGAGPLRVGMTFAEADAALGAKLNVSDDYGNGLMACNYGRSDALPGVVVMVDGGKVVRFDAAEEGDVRSDRGIAEGAPVAAVLAAYPEGLKREPHHYVEAPAHYLEWYNADRTRGIRYEIDQEGRVSSLYAGAAPNVGYVEGCS